MADKKALCGYCAKERSWTVTRDVPGSPVTAACSQHLAVACAKTAEVTGAASVTVYLAGRGGETGNGQLPATEHVLEQVRRVGAHSAEPETAHSMEDALYLGVLGAIAQGAPQPSVLAAAALTTQRYGFERRAGR
jgi:hypothetical protein